MTIWKFPLKIVDVQTIHAPITFRALSVQVQNGIPCLWAIVDPEAPRDNLQIKIAGTGHPLDSDCIEGFSYLDTIQMGEFVWHVFLTLQFE